MQRLLIIFAASLAVFPACGFEYSKLKQGAGGGTTQVGLVSYALVKVHVFEPNCYRCHSAAAGNRGGINLESYQNVIANLDDIQYDVFVDHSMPEDGPMASEADMALLDAWIQAGAPLNPEPAPSASSSPVPAPSVSPLPSPSPTPSAPPAPVITSWSHGVQGIFQAHCIECHQGKDHGFDARSYANVVDWSAGVFRRALVEKSMPPRKRTQLTQDERDSLTEWFAQGAPQ